MRIALIALPLILLLAACGSTPEPRPQEVAAPAAPQPVELLAEVRRAVAEQPPAFEVQPLRDPSVEDLREQARQAEARIDPAAALAALDQALTLSPDDPELRQWRAEILLAKGQLEEAEVAAADAYESGPRVGSLCLRSWHTVRVAREARGLGAGAQRAAAMLDRCRVEPPPRL